MKYLLIIILFISIGCGTKSQQSVQSSNSKFDVELLFEVDGCKVYRFEDGMHHRYFTNCKGSTSWTQSNGKSSYEMEIPTN